MDDLFDIGYIIFIILIFLFSVFKNRAKGKKQTAPPQRKSRPPADTKSAAGEDFIERKLAEFLGLDVPPAKKTPPPKPVAEPIKKSVPQTSSQKVKPKPAKYVEREKTEKTGRKKRRSRPGALQSSYRQRIIWAEILAPPRARRKGRAV